MSLCFALGRLLWALDPMSLSRTTTIWMSRHTIGLVIMSKFSLAQISGINTLCLIDLKLVNKHIETAEIEASRTTVVPTVFSNHVHSNHYVQRAVEQNRKKRWCSRYSRNWHPFGEMISQWWWSILAGCTTLTGIQPHQAWVLMHLLQKLQDHSKM